MPSPAELEPARYAQPLGLGPELEISVNEAPFTATAAIVLYTDGLYEARDRDGELGIPRVLSALAAATSRTAAEIVATLRTTVTEFSQRALRDDVCIVVLRRR
jgi:serine phosphatase RsbU (regulator of sigma subunit)